MVWAVSADISTVTVAKAVVTSEQDIVPLRSPYSGTIVQHRIVEGETVSQGQPLVYLDTAEDKLQLRHLSAQYFRNSVKHSRILAELDSQTSMVWADPFSHAPIDPDWINSEIAVFETNVEKKRHQNAEHASLVRKLEIQLTGLRLQQKSLTDRHALLLQELKDAEHLLDRGHGGKSRLAAIKAEIATADAQLAQLKTDHTQTEIVLSDADLERQAVDIEYRDRLLKDLQLASEQKAAFKNEIEAVNVNLRKARLDAPIDGILFDSIGLSAGMVVTAGQEIARIVPAGSDIWLVADIPTSQINRIYVGQSANISFASIQGDYIALAKAVVAAISPAPVVSEDRSQKIYKVRLKLKKFEALEFAAETLPIGSKATVYFRGSETTVAGYIFAPFNEVLAKIFRTT
ncbi:MAG: HlyD family efflux transporter periplasmic adaptor subunit [Pseudomonadota bacterium]